jgi:hypothetical protein
MDTIYLVMGESGEYSDWQQWPVRAFATEAAADAHAAAANAWNKEIQEEILRREAALGPRPTYSFPLSDEGKTWIERVRPAYDWYKSQRNPHDPDHESPTAATYDVYPVPFTET